MKCDEIFAALAMLEKERGIPQDFMMNKIVQALTTAYKRDHEGVENVVVEVNEEKRDLKMFVQKEIVEEVENPGSQISLEEARRISAKYELGAQQHILDIGEELGQNDAPPRDLGPVEKQGVDHAAGDGGQHIAGEIGVAAGGQKEAEGILGGAEHDHRQRAADQ